MHGGRPQQALSFDAPPIPSSSDTADDGRPGRPTRPAVLVLLVVAVPVVVIVGLIDRAAGHPTRQPVETGAIRSSPVRYGSAGRVGVDDPDRSDAPLEAGLDRVSSNRPADRATMVVSIGPSTTRSAPASTAAVAASMFTGTIGAEPVEVDLDQRFRRFVADSNLDQVEYLTPLLVHGTKVTGDQRINVLILDHVRTAGIRVSPGSRPPARVGTWATEIGAQAALNANWFSTGGGFDGPFVADGTVFGGHDHGYTALFGFTAEKRLATQHHTVVNDLVEERVVQAVAGHPTLVDRGRVTTDFGGDPTFTRRHPRTAIGAAYGGEIVVFVTVDGRSPGARGMTGAETASLMTDLGVSHGVMLDGGGSSAMWIEGRGVVNVQSDPGRRVGNQIAIYGH